MAGLEDILLLSQLVVLVAYGQVRLEDLVEEEVPGMQQQVLVAGIVEVAEQMVVNLEQVEVAVRLIMVQTKLVL